MPLWSVQEWRARIGTSWCAVGRPIRSKSFYRSRGCYLRSPPPGGGDGSGGRRESHGRHGAVTVVMMIVLLIGAILTFLHFILAGDRLVDACWCVCTPIDLLLVQWMLAMSLVSNDVSRFLSKSWSLLYCSDSVDSFIGGLEALPSSASGHSQYCRITITCVRMEKKQTHEQDICRTVLSNFWQSFCGKMRNIKLCLASAVVKASLLLRCGDVEMNPGPLSIEDLRLVQTATWEARAMWFDIGLVLGIDVHTLDSIRRDHHNNPDDCFREMLSMWLNEVGPKPTWSALAEALRSVGHGSSAVRLRHFAEPLPEQLLCKLPGCNRPRFVELGGKMYDFCGLAHAQLYKLQNAPRIPQHLQCAAPGCTRKKYPNKQGGYYNYCSKYCRDSDIEKRGFERDVRDALNKGACVVLHITKILVTGAATSGKTCTKHYIFDLPSPNQYTSTDVFEPMERYYTYYSAVADPHNHCRWKEATLCTTYDMIKKCLQGKYNIVFEETLGSNVQIDSHSVPSGTDAQVNPERGQGQSAVTQSAFKKLLDHTQDMSGDIIHLHWIHFVDSGGQSEFLELLPALVSNVTVTVYVIDLSVTPDEVCNDYFTDNNQPQGDAERKTQLTGKQIFERFIMTISSQTQKDKVKCKVMFVGTHYDKTDKVVSNLEKWENFIVDFWNNNDTLEKVEIIKTAIKMRNVHAIDAIKGDNQHGGGDNQHRGRSNNQQPEEGNNQQPEGGDNQHGEDDDIQQQTAAEYMRKELVKCYVEKRVAIAEFLIEEDLKTRSTSQENYGILSYSKCLEHTHLYANETTLKKALQYFHELNEFIVYFEPAGADPADEKVADPKPDLVFTKPGILVQIISRLIKVANCYRHDSTTIPKTFSIDGIITEDNLVTISNCTLRHGEKADEHFNIEKYFRKDIFDAKKVLKVLQKFFIAASHTGSEYFIPCVLPPLDVQYTSDFMKSNHPLLITFKGCVPRGLFCGLVTYLLNRCKWEIRPKNNQNYRTLIEFLTPEGRKYKVVLKDTFRAICIYVDMASNEQLTIRKEIVDGILTVCKKFYDSDDGCNMNLNASFYCPCEKKTSSHIANVITCENKTQPRLQCKETDDIVHVTPEKRSRYSVWLYESENPWQSEHPNLGGVDMIQPNDSPVNPSIDEPLLPQSDEVGGGADVEREESNIDRESNGTDLESGESDTDKKRDCSLCSQKFCKDKVIPLGSGVGGAIGVVLGLIVGGSIYSRNKMCAAICFGVGVTAPMVVFAAVGLFFSIMINYWYCYRRRQQ